ncbi:hypothetical protein BGZ99_009989 [Dissophora globulifera]|uniref:Uncharacterized protein n=1 Tax=Dissophora globulifera TaxID=979702 RepID=A0A9P6R4F0_9FUNG|nr:hypothetical protein BGZ99_009989 [Dissophora globulifera]
MSQQRHSQGPPSTIDPSLIITSNASTNNDDNTNNGSVRPPRPRLQDRPNSSPSASRSSLAFHQLHQPDVSSSSSSAGSAARGSKARPPNAVLPGTSRPKTMYQAVTWKENLDAFNRRLRRGSMNMDAAAQEEELLNSEVSVQAEAQRLEDQEYLDRSSTQESIASDVDENSRLLSNHGRDLSSYDGHRAAPVATAMALGSPGAGYGATTATASITTATTAPSKGGRYHHDRSTYRSSAASGSEGEPVFPTRLNPVMATTKSSKLGVLSGVFVPCVLSIWGIILFLRFGFIIGQAGVMGTLGMFVVGYLINIFTSLSLSAISTNGTVRGGGVYYLLSRSLGPEFGGSIGLIYFLCTVIGCGMNVLGFVEPLIANFGEASGSMYRVLPESPIWSFIYGTMLLISCTLVCLVGSKLFARSSLVLAVVILLSTLSIFVSFAVMPPFTHPERNIEYTGFSWDTLQENMWPRFTTTNGPEGTKQSFQTVFGVLFPACIGILAGASMSGDLEDPSKSIPKGTLWAVGSTFCVYTCIVILMGGSISRSTMYTDLSVLQDVSISPLFIASGALAASVFATLGSVIGAAKILQAIARDNLLPLLAVFGQGTPRTDEPTLAVLVTYLLCQFCLFLTDMNAIATFVSLITLLTFLILNLACFLLKIGSAPNFRPSFRFFHWWTAFAGMVLSAVVMCFVDLGQSLLSGLMTAVLFIWIHYWSPPKRWGDVTQSLIYHQVRKYLLRLDSRKEHVKFWRPQILLLVHHPRSEYQLIQFCNHLKKGALYVLGHVILGDLRDVLTEYRRQQGSWLKFVDVTQIKAFVNLSVADSIRIGARNLLIGTGLGGMRPNIVVLGSFNLQRYLREKREQQHQQSLLQQQRVVQPQTPQHPQSPNMFKGGITPGSVINNSNTDHTLLNIPTSLPIDNIRVEAPIKITEYVSIIEDVLSLNKAVAIGYGFDRLELPEEHKAGWKQLIDRGSNMFSQLLQHTPLASSNQNSYSASTSAASSSYDPTSRPSSIRKQKEDSHKKKYIDLWPMQMSITPLQCFDPNQVTWANKRASRDLSSNSPKVPSAPGTGGLYPEGPGGFGTNNSNTHVQGGRMPESNLTNFDTYAMVLQMGCILHMVPQWKDNYQLRVMVFVEYKEDVEEEKERLHALLENLRIPAEVKVMCLDGGDSETYAKLARGESLESGLNNESNTMMSMAPVPVGPSEEDMEDPVNVLPVAPVAQRPSGGPRNINPHWQQQEPLHEEEEEEEDDDEKERVGETGLTPLEHEPASPLETGPYSSVAGEHSRQSSGTMQPARPLMDPISPPSTALPQRRSTISHASRPGPQRQLSPNFLRVNTSTSPRLRQGSPIAVASAHPSSSNYRYYSGGGGTDNGGGSTALRYRSNTMAGSTSPSVLDSRLGTSVPLGTSMNFRVGVPLPRKYFDPSGSNSGSESDSISSEDDEDYDQNDDDLVYGGMYPPQQLQQQQRQQVQTRRLSLQLSPAAQRLYQHQLQSQHQASQQQQQQQQRQQHQHQQHSSQQAPPNQPSSPAFVHTSLGSQHQGLGIVVGDAALAGPTQDTLGGNRGRADAYQKYPSAPTDRQQSQHVSSLSPTAVDNNHWAGSGAAATTPSRQQNIASSDAGASADAGVVWSQPSLPAFSQDIQFSSSPPEQVSEPVVSAVQPASPFATFSPPTPFLPNFDDHFAGGGAPASPSSFLSNSYDNASPFLSSSNAAATAAAAFGVTSPPIQFDHQSPETQLMILNELMRIHSSAESTSIVFTTVPAPEEGTCQREQSSLAYLEKLDLLMDGVDVPVLLLHAKSLTVTMTL